MPCRAPGGWCAPDAQAEQKGGGAYFLYSDNLAIYNSSFEGNNGLSRGRERGAGRRRGGGEGTLPRLVWCDDTPSRTCLLRRVHTTALFSPRPPPPPRAPVSRFLSALIPATSLQPAWWAAACISTHPTRSPWSALPSTSTSPRRGLLGRLTAPCAPHLTTQWRWQVPPNSRDEGLGNSVQVMSAAVHSGRPS